MSRPIIKFEEGFVKLNADYLWLDEPVTLLEVFRKDKADLSKKFLNYDTKRLDRTHYKLEEGKYLILLFMQMAFRDAPVLFTTLRKDTPENFRKYMFGRGKKWSIEIVERRR